MPRTLGSQRHEALRKFIKEKRTIETGQRRIDVVELVELAAALGFDPQAALRLVKSIKGS
jgi:hypothetical protein